MMMSILKTCWCSGGNEAMKLGIPLKETMGDG